MKLFDRAYFEKWYRGRERVITHSELQRKVAFAVATAEYVLDRPLKSVLDVGCGEGAWFPHLEALRPKAIYLGLDSSDYAVRRFGKRRNIRQVAFGELALDRDYDLVVCSDVLHYLDAGDIQRGIPEIARHAAGIAFLEFMTREDRVEGDLEGFIRRPFAWYKRLFNDSGLEQIAPSCWQPEPRPTRPARG